MRYSILTEEQQDGNWRVRLFYGGRTLHDTTVPEAHIPQAEQECWAAQEEHLLTHSVEIGGTGFTTPKRSLSCTATTLQAQSPSLTKCASSNTPT